MRKWLLMFFSLPCAVACASVLGLEEAELEDSGGSCSYGASDLENECVTDCWNSACCTEALDCFDDVDGSCTEYLDCLTDCDSDAADCNADCSDASCEADCTDAVTSCRTDCASSFPKGQRLSTDLASCTLGCGCALGNGNGNGGGGSGGSGSGNGGSGNGNAGSGNGNAGNGSSGPPCTTDDPASCVSSTRVQVCIDGTYETEACSTLCDTLGYGSGPCSGSGCQCGAPLDDQCAAGTAGYCICVAGTENECTPDIEVGAYVGCYTGDPEAEPLIRCLSDYYFNGNIDCSAASVCLF